MAYSPALVAVVEEVAPVAAEAFAAREERLREEETPAETAARTAGSALGLALGGPAVSSAIQVAADNLSGVV